MFIPPGRLGRRRPLKGAAAASRPHRPVTDRVRENKFDSESGLVFSEVEVRPQRANTSNWMHDLAAPHTVKKPAPYEQGARSLADIARTKVIKEFRNLTPDHFATVPWPIAERIWEQIVSSRTKTFHIWRTLATAYPDVEEFGGRRNRYLLHIKQPLLPFTDYYRGITSPEMRWLACLRLSPKQISTQTLVAIHEITNLAVLDLSDTGSEYGDIRSNFDERLMLSWAQLAAQSKAFQHLRVLMFGWQENLSDWIFKYTDRFPSLCHVIVTDCPQIHQKNRMYWEPISQAAGWEARHAKRSAKSLRRIIQSDDFYDFYLGSVSGCYYESQELFTQLSHPKRPKLIEHLPLLETWLGAPRPWSHIVDDFPGHRTTPHADLNAVFFENTNTMGPDLEGAGTEKRAIREQTKRARNSEPAVSGAVSPPPKRGSQPRREMRAKNKNLTDMLQEFNS